MGVQKSTYVNVISVLGIIAGVGLSIYHAFQIYMYYHFFEAIQMSETMDTPSAIKLQDLQVFNLWFNQIMYPGVLVASILLLKRKTYARQIFAGFLIFTVGVSFFTTSRNVTLQRALFSELQTKFLQHKAATDTKETDKSLYNALELAGFGDSELVPGFEEQQEMDEARKKNASWNSLYNLLTAAFLLFHALLLFAATWVCVHLFRKKYDAEFMPAYSESNNAEELS